MPPPPAAALSITGKPMRSASLATAASSRTGSRVPGTTGTPAATASRRAEVFSPMSAIVSLRGPMKAIPSCSQARAKSGFSARKPYPGWMASAPVAFAASSTRSIRR